MRKTVDIDKVELFEKSLHDYIGFMKNELGSANQRMQAAAYSTRDGAVSGAAKNVEDSFRNLARLIADLESTQKVIGQKKLSYYRSAEKGKRLTR